MLTKKAKLNVYQLISIVISAFFLLSMTSMASAGGLFGAPETASKKAGGLNTAIGYRYHEDIYKNHTDHVVRQNSIYSQVAYGAKNTWEIYGRIGISDLRISDSFVSTHVLTTTSKNNFEDNWKFFGTLGAKGFYPFNEMFGMGAFVQGTFHFGDYTDSAAGRGNGASHSIDFKVKNFWDVNFGIGLQATVPCGIKLYMGPYVYHSEADASVNANFPGIELGRANVLLKNKSIAGAFFGVDIPLSKGFRLNIEGQYAQRLSFGSAIAYVY